MKIKTQCAKLGNVVTAVFGEKLIVVNAYIKKNLRSVT